MVNPYRHADVLKGFSGSSYCALEQMLHRHYVTLVAFLVFKALHIIFVVTWFAALFYIVRLFIYSTEADEHSDSTVRGALLAQFAVMQRRLWFGIGWPSAILTLFFGGSLVFHYLFVFSIALPAWLLTKFTLLVPLFAYHLACHWIYRQQSVHQFRFSSFQLRIWNEVATVFLFAIVFVAVLREQLSIQTLVALTGAVAALLTAAIFALSKR